MEESSRGGGGESSSSKATPSCFKIGDRELFNVELRPGETTIVSWKKLVKDANKSNGGSTSAPDPAPVNPSPNPSPNLESRMVPGQRPENKEDEVPAGPNRFSAVIEKIERLYMGKDSSDEEDDLKVKPDDDQYDTEDSFIDDTELDEYFEVDEAAMKHDGFFVNRGKLEIIEPTVGPDPQPKKKRRKEITKAPGESGGGNTPNKHSNPGKSAAGRTGPLLGKDSSSPNQNLGMESEHYKDVKQKKPSNALGMSSRSITGEAKTKLDPSSHNKVSNGCDSVSRAEAKEKETTRPAALPAKNHIDKSKETSGFSDASHKKYHDKSAHAPSKELSAKATGGIDDFEPLVRAKEKSGAKGLPDLNVSEGKIPVPPTGPQQIRRKDGFNVRPKVSVLEKTIKELEKMVAESRPPAVEIQDADASSHAVKKRLPREIKLKLAKVARIAVASQGRISKELQNRLMDILGHLIQLRTLKRNLKEMINMSMSAKQEKEDVLQHLKKEVFELIKSRVSSLKPKQQAGASDDVQQVDSEDKGSRKEKLVMDMDLEEKICDLYDLFVDGLDEDIGPHVRKLYVELAQLWPSGLMDNHGIRIAISRAKARRRKAMNSRAKDEAKIKRKKISAPRFEETVWSEGGSVSQPQISREKSSRDAAGFVLGLAKQNTNPSVATNRVTSPSAIGSDSDRFKQEKQKGSSSNSMERSKEGADGALIKKKTKRKPEEDLNRTQMSEELNSQPSKAIKQASGLPKRLDIQLNAPPPSSETV